MDYDTIWSGARGSYLCADVPGNFSYALRHDLALRADAPREGRGYRPVGLRFRDTVYAVVTERLSLVQICARLESTGDRDLALISRALKTLVDDGELQRELVKLGRGKPRWVYWRP